MALTENFIHVVRRIFSYHFDMKLVRKANTYRLQLAASKKVTVKLQIIWSIYFLIPGSMMVAILRSRRCDKEFYITIRLSFELESLYEG